MFVQGKGMLKVHAATGTVSWKDESKSAGTGTESGSSAPLTNVHQTQVYGTGSTIPANCPGSDAPPQPSQGAAAGQADQGDVVAKNLTNSTGDEKDEDNYVETGSTVEPVDTAAGTAGLGNHFRVISTTAYDGPVTSHSSCRAQFDAPVSSTEGFFDLNEPALLVTGTKANKAREQGRPWHVRPMAMLSRAGHESRDQATH